MRNAIPTLLDRINEGAAHWHRQMNALSGGELNGSHGRVLTDALNTEEELDALWLTMRKERAAMQIPWFTDEDEIFTNTESVFDMQMHIVPVN